MINIDKDYLITVDLKKSSVKSDRTIFFYNTDLNICNIFIKLICTDKDKSIPNDLVVELAVLKPESNEFKTLNATLISEEDLLYEVDLTTDYFDIVGKYECEIRISETVNGEIKCLTSESFNYIVKPNITAKLNNEIKNDKNLPILEKLIKDVKELSLGIETNQVQMKTDEDLVGDNKTIVGAINQLREDFNSGISGGTVDLTNYQKKNDETLQTTSKEIVGAINEVNTQCEDITKYISPSSLDEFVELTKEGGLFYSLTSFPIVYNNNTYNVVGLIDSRPHSGGYSYYAFHKMWQFLINPDTKAVTSFSSFSEFLQKKIPSDASKLSIIDTNDNFISENIEGALEELSTQCKDIANNQPTDLSLDSATNLLQLVNSKGSKLGNGITLPMSSGGGTSQYLHIKYSSTGAPQLAGQISDTPNAYIGLCVDTNADSPTNPRSYTWYKWKGDTPNLAIGTVETLASGSSATASITGTAQNPLLNLGIPKGENGTGGSSDTLVTTNISGTTLSLTTDKYQTTTVVDGTEITLPAVTSFREIHLFFNTTTDLTLILPSCKWQNGNTPTISANKTYEFVFTFVTEWLGGVIVYE